MKTIPGRMPGWAAYLLTLMDEREKQALERHKALKESIAQALAAAQRASDKAEDATQRRFEAGNEIKAAMQDQAGLMATKVELAGAREAMEIRLDALQGHINALQTGSDTRTGRDTGAGQSWHVIGWAVAAASGVVVVLKFVMGL